MYATCTFCACALGRNDLVEPFPVGRKLAFDGARGRLWVICPQCGGWNLAPLEERWEAIESCERAYRGTRVRVSTANIGMATHRSGVELVRIGEPLRPEFAAWRYAPRIKRRRRQAMLVTVGAGAALAGVTIGALAAGAGLGVLQLGQFLWERANGQRPVLRLPGSGHVLRRKHLPEVRWTPARDAAPWRLTLPLLGRGASTITPEERELTGTDGMRVAALALAVLNRKAGRDAELRDAVDWIDVCGSPFTGAEPGTDAVLEAARGQRREELERRHAGATHELYAPLNLTGPLQEMPAYQRLAFELAANEDQEHLFLTTHLWLLERHWREAEEIAAIADNLLVPEEVSAALRRLQG